MSAVINLSEQNTQKKSDNNFDKTVKKQKFNRRKGVVIAIIAALVIVVIGVYFCFSKLFFVKNIVVVEKEESEFESPYTEQQLYDGLGIEKGKGLYSFDASETEEKAAYNLTYFKEINISRKWPGTVCLNVVLEEPAFYCEISDKIYIVSKDLKVLEYTSDSKKIKLLSLIYLETPGIHNCIVGEKLGLDENSEKNISELLAKFEEYAISENITSLNITDRFNVEFMYDTVYLVKLGDMKNLDAKILLLTKIVEDRKGNMSGGVIDLSNASKKEAKFDKFS